MEDYLILPEATNLSDPAWFGFPITIRDNAKVQRVSFLKFLNQEGIGTRLIFAGNLIRQPYFIDQEYRIATDLSVTDKIMNQTFWIGLYPGISKKMLDYSVMKIKEYFGIGW